MKETVIILQALFYAITFERYQYFWELIKTPQTQFEIRLSKMWRIADGMVIFMSGMGMG